MILIESPVDPKIQSRDSLTVWFRFWDLLTPRFDSETPWLYYSHSYSETYWLYLRIHWLHDLDSKEIWGSLTILFQFRDSFTMIQRLIGSLIQIQDSFTLQFRFRGSLTIWFKFRDSLVIWFRLKSHLLYGLNSKTFWLYDSDIRFTEYMI